jgi:hypothetical protein
MPARIASSKLFGEEDWISVTLATDMRYPRELVVVGEGIQPRFS